MTAEHIEVSITGTRPGTGSTTVTGEIAKVANLQLLPGAGTIRRALAQLWVEHLEECTWQIYPQTETDMIIRAWRTYAEIFAHHYKFGATALLSELKHTLNRPPAPEPILAQFNAHQRVVAEAQVALPGPPTMWEELPDLITLGLLKEPVPEGKAGYIHEGKLAVWLREMDNQPAERPRVRFVLDVAALNSAIRVTGRDIEKDKLSYPNQSKGIKTRFLTYLRSVQAYQALVQDVEQSRTLDIPLAAAHWLIKQVNNVHTLNETRLNRDWIDWGSMYRNPSGRAFTFENLQQDFPPHLFVDTSRADAQMVIQRCLMVLSEEVPSLLPLVSEYLGREAK